MNTNVLLTFDVDFQYLWIGQFKNIQLSNLSRGEFGAKVGLPRILDLLDRENVKATFFVPGKVAELYPELIKELHRKGHEVGVHGYAHERWNELNYDEEKAILIKSKQILETLLDTEIVGFRSPAWNLNEHSVDLLLELGFKYDSSLMAGDFHPYYLRTGDRITEQLDIKFGEETELLEFPVAWELDDFPYFTFTGRTMGLSSPDFVLERWIEEVDFASQLESSVVTYTMHPQVIGRGPRIKMLENLINYIKKENRATFSTMSQCLANQKEFNK